MTLIQLLTLLKSEDPFTIIVFIGVILVLSWNGIITIKGLQFKKKTEAIVTPPVACLRGRAGSCELVRLQMESAESIMSRIKNESYSDYLKIRKEKLGGKTDLAKDRDAHHYNAVLYHINDIVKDQIRYFFRENHLADMTEDEFHSHIKKRATEIMSTITEQLSLLYYADSDPDRIELYDYNMQHITPMAREAIFEVFRTGRILAVKFNKGELDDRLSK